MMNSYSYDDSKNKYYHMYSFVYALLLVVQYYSINSIVAHRVVVVVVLVLVHHIRILARKYYDLASS
jgi:hypothetical protein